MKTTTDPKTAEVTTEMSPAERTKLASSADILRKFSWYESSGLPALEGSLAELAAIGEKTIRQILSSTEPVKMAEETATTTPDKAVKKAKEPKPE